MIHPYPPAGEEAGERLLLFNMVSALVGGKNLYGRMGVGWGRKDQLIQMYLSG